MKLAALLLAVTGLVALVAQVARPGAAATSSCASLDFTDVYLSEGPPNAIDAAVNLRALGTLRAAVIFVDFSDAPGTESPAEIVERWLVPGIAWLNTSSYDRLAVALQPSAEWVRMPQPAASYGFARGLTYETHRAYIADALAAADPTFDFSRTDIVYVVAARTGLVPFSPNFRGAPGTFVADGRELGPAVTFGLDAYFFGRTIVPHETGHAFGLPDLYAFSGDTHRFVGTWDLMGDVFTATDFFAWHRLKLGWLDPEQVVCVAKGFTKTVVLRPLAATGGRKAVFVRTGSTTGLLVENRQPMANDSPICDRGALVYTVDSAVATGLGPMQVVGGSTPGCGHGSLSDAPLHKGEGVTVGNVDVAVVASPGPNVKVRVTVR